MCWCFSVTTVNPVSDDSQNKKYAAPSKTASKSFEVSPEMFSRSIVYSGLSVASSAVTPTIKAIYDSNRLMGPLIKKICKQSKDIQKLIFGFLSTQDLASVRAVVQTLPPDLWKAFTARITVAEILSENPSWTTIASSWNVKDQDKIWLLRLHQLYSLNCTNLKEKIVTNHSQWAIFLKLPSAKTPDLLKHKQAIGKVLSEITFFMAPKAVVKPSAIPNVFFLLPNLRTISLRQIAMKVFPDLSQNAHIQELILSHNELTEIPDLSHMTALKRLDLGYNQLTLSPNVSSLANLEVLKLASNRLSTPPDLKGNKKLKTLDLSSNQLTNPPDLTRNTKLTNLDLLANKCVTCPQGLPSHFQIVEKQGKWPFPNNIKYVLKTFSASN